MMQTPSKPESVPDYAYEVHGRASVDSIFDRELSADDLENTEFRAAIAVGGSYEEQEFAGARFNDHITMELLRDDGKNVSANIPREVAWIAEVKD